MNISLKQLRAFLSVAETGSFTEAARRLHLTQSALSLQLKELEREVGFKLLNRTTRRVDLSDAGREFQPMAQKVLDDLQSVIRSASEVGLVRRGVVRVGATEALACAIVAPAIAAYGKHRPAIEVRLVDTLVRSMLIPLRDSEVDYVIGPASLAGSGLDAGVSWVPLFESPFALWCAPDHALAGRRRVTWNELLEHQLIVSSVDFSSRLIPQLRGHLGDKKMDRALSGNVPQPRQVSNIITGLSLASVGLGAAIAPQYIGSFAQAFGLSGAVLVQPSLTRIVALYSRKGHALSPAADDFLSFVRGFVEERGLKAAS